MTREEEIRQEMSKIAGTHPDWSKNDCMRMGFLEGAKWADKTMIDKACEWLKLNTDWDDEWDEMGRNIDYGMIEEFRKAMEL